MLTPDTPRRRLRGLAAASLVAMLLVPAGTTMAMEPGPAEVEPADATVSVAPTKEDLQSLVDDLNLANDALAADNTSLQAQVDALADERDRLADSLHRFDELYEPLESDRQLLFELRKSMPETRPEAEAQLARIRTLALASDPARLGQLVDRIDDSAPAFLDWRFGDHASPQEFSAAYIDSGANAFDANMEEFRSEALRTVANRLDGLLTILDRVR